MPGLVFQTQVHKRDGASKNAKFLMNAQES